MERIITQDIWLEFQPRERSILSQIHSKKKKIEELSQKKSELSDDIQTAQDLLTLLFRERYEREGFKKGAQVIFKEKGSTHNVDFLFFDSESNQMAVILNPALKRGGHKLTYVDELKLVKSKKKSKRK